VGGRAGGETDQGAVSRLVPEDRNHVIVPPGVEGKIKTNIQANQLLKLLEQEDCNPTSAEKKVLAQYVGRGAFSQ
jgi:hypothetical protein